MPPDCIWTGKGYSQTRYDAWRAQEYAHMWNGFVAGRRTTPDREAWISVSESVPQTADFVLAVNKLGAIKCAQYWHGEWIGMGGVTHWMPLPAAPTSDQGEKS
ncbi:hypothetical protein C6Q01_17290 [Burkholderia multivorans]|nr:hypothetical protein C6Q01_17290 [Burkholderia multivorans]PRF89784.1 hypothetical protein C6Q23_14195 [Burkholderia multivorans]